MHSTSMPLYVYHHQEAQKNCPDEFEVLQAIKDLPLTKCPKCGEKCRKSVTASSITGVQKTNVRERAKSLGFKAFKRKAHGEYERI